MSRTSDELVRDFCKLWASPDPDEIAGYFTDDAIYHNMPMEPVQGRQAIKEFVAGFVAEFDGMDFQVQHQISHGNVVVNERVDVMRRKTGDAIHLPVMGIFEIVDDRIAAWREYFDLASITNAYS